ncbi:MAG: glycerol-3-phosphate dehydrogenase [Pseudomonadota bacterium]
MEVDLLIIGGGINGAGIARDAAGRGLSVLLCEQGDLACATSSASTKLIHGGLRYLEHYQFRLVAEALAEREVLMKIAPHLVTPLTFVLPWVPGMRPRWILRIGLWLYDHLGRRVTLPPSRAVNLVNSPLGDGLVAGLNKGFAYSDCRVDDARLVIANALAAEKHDAQICTHTRCVSAQRQGNQWMARLESNGDTMMVCARALVNAAGPWVKQVMAGVVQQPSQHGVRLVQGSHIMVPKLYEGERAYLLQNHDRRVIMVIPYGGAYTLVGTTDVPFDGDPGAVHVLREEEVYLCAAVSRYFQRKLSPEDVVWRYSGVRALYDDGSVNPSRVTRDYKLVVEGGAREAPLLSVFGGKITTYRRLAEHVLDKLKPWFPRMGRAWTATAPLPGGIMHDFESLVADLVSDWPQLPENWLRALARRHGALAREVLGHVKTRQDLGQDFGAGLYQHEVDYFIEREWARTAEDILWRRTKAGLFMDDSQRMALENYLLRRRKIG